MAYRVVKNRESIMRSMKSGQSAISISSSASKGFSPMRNTDILRAAESGDWSELIAKASASTNRFRRQFYA